MPSSFFAVRGSRPLSDEEFNAHLALAIRLENVGVLLGAGASKSVGGLVMEDIWKLVTANEDVAKLLKDEKFVRDGETPNIEIILDRLEIACLDGARSGADLGEIKQARHVLRKAVLNGAMLEKELWDNPDKALIHKKLAPHVRLVSRLAGNRQPGQSAPWIFTTNYDLALEWSAEALGLHCVNGFTGLHDRAFRPSSFDLGLRNVHAKGEARFGTYNLYLAKLHGSVSWLTRTDGSLTELACEAIKPKIDSFLASDEPNDWPGLMILPGASKFVQTAGFVYGEIIRRFTEFLARPNACLIISGYGFTDDHINRLIVSALQNPTLQLIIYLPEIDRLGLFPSLAASGTAIVPNEQLRRLLLAQLPQVTVRGHGDSAFFNALSEELPEPALLDDVSERARSIEQLLRNATSFPVPVTRPEALDESAADAQERAPKRPKTTGRGQ